MAGLGLRLGLGLGRVAGGAAAPWYTQGKANDIDPTYWADFVRGLYAYKKSPIRVASVRNQAYYDRINQATMDGHLIKQHHVLGDDYSSLMLSFTNKYLVANTGDTNTGNGFTIQDMALVNAAGSIVVPIYFAGGRTKAIADGDIDIQSDPIYPSAFGLTKFSKDEEYYIKGRVTGAADFYVPFGQNKYLALSTNKTWWYNTAATTPSSTDAAGDYTNAAGVALTSGYNGLYPFLLGASIKDTNSIFGAGDSIEMGVGDTVASKWGGGFLQRAMRSASNDDSIPCINFGIASIRTDVVAASAYATAYMKYCKNSVVCLGTNDFFASATLVTMQTRIASVWSLLRLQGIQSIINQELFFYTTGAWTDDAGQTIVGGWQSGQVVDQFNQWLATKLADGTINFLLSNDTVESTTTPFKWLANNTSDGIHPNPTGHENLAVVLRPVVRSLNSAKQMTTSSAANLVSFTRASTATYFDSTGTMQTAAIDTLRYDYNPITLQPLGILVEDQRTNLVLNSTTGTNQSVTVTATAHTLSFYGTGTVTLSGAYAGSLVGTGAYPVRSTLTFTPSAGSLTIACTGTIQFIQIEAGAQATSYIATTGSSATRAADLPLSNAGNTIPFATWVNNGVGTIVAEFDMPYSPTGATRVIEMWGSSNESMSVSRTSSVLQIVRRTGGVSEFNPIYAQSFTAGAVVKTAGVFVNNDYTVTANGGPPVNDATSPQPLTPIRIHYGFANGPASAINGHLRSIRFYPFRVTNAELIRLTT